MKEGRVTAAGAPVKANAKPVPGLVIEVRIPPPAPAIPRPEAIPLDIVYEDADCLVVNKPAGLVVHPAPGHATGTLVNALLYHCRDLAGIGGVERPGIVHRLDKDTSGLMIVAKTERAMAGFVKMFQTGGLTKMYRALVHGIPPRLEGRIESLIGRHPTHRQKMAIVEKNGKRAVTHYRIEKKLGPVTLVSCRIETGRTHQIRVHMQSIGCPVVGDALYGKPALDRQLPIVPARQMLHSAHLAFVHPVTGKPLEFDAPLPPDFSALLAALSKKR